MTQQQLLVHLQNIPALKNLNEDHLDSFSWKVRQKCFVALFDELGNMGSINSERHKLRALVDARSSVTRSQLSPRKNPPKLNLGNNVLSLDAFKCAFMKIVSDALFAFGEDVKPSVLMNEDDQTECLKALNFFSTIYYERKIQDQGSKQKNKSSKHLNSNVSEDSINGNSIRLVDDEDRREHEMNDSIGGKWSRGDLQGGGGVFKTDKPSSISSSTRNSHSSSSSSSSAVSSVSSAVPRVKKTQLGVGFGSSSPRSHNNSKPQVSPRLNQSSSSFTSSKSSSVFTQPSIGMSMEGLYRSNKQTNSYDVDDVNNDEKHDRKYDKNNDDQSDDDNYESDPGALQCHSEHGNGHEKFSSFQMKQNEVLRGQVVALQREIELSNQECNAQSKVVLVANQLLERLETSLNEVLLELNPNLSKQNQNNSGEHDSTKTNIKRSSSTSASSSSKGKDLKTPSSYLSEFNTRHLLNKLDNEDDEDDEESRQGGGGGGGGGGVKKVTEKVMLKLLKHTVAMRKELKEVQHATRRDMGRNRTIGDDSLTNPFIRRKLKKPSELASCSQDRGNWRVYADSSKSPIPFSGTSFSTMKVSPLTSNSVDGDEKAPRRINTEKMMMMMDKEDEDIMRSKKDEMLWPPNKSSNIVEGNGANDDGRDDITCKTVFSSFSDRIRSSELGNEGGSGAGNDLQNQKTDFNPVMGEEDNVTPRSKPASNPPVLSTSDQGGDVQVIHSSPNSKSNLVNYQELAILEACSPIQMQSVLAIATSLETVTSKLEELIKALHKEGISTGGTMPRKEANENLENNPIGHIAFTARRLADHTSELSARMTAFAPLLPSPSKRYSMMHQDSGETDHHVPLNETIPFSFGESSSTPQSKGRKQNEGGGSAKLLESFNIDQRTGARGRIAQLVGGIAVKGGASRQRLRALIEHLDAGYNQWWLERSLLRWELEAWRSREVVVTAALQALIVELEQEWNRRAGSILETSLIEPLTTILNAHQKFIQSSSSSSSSSSTSFGAYDSLRKGCLGKEAAILMEALHIYSHDLTNVLHEVTS